MGVAISTSYNNLHTFDVAPVSDGFWCALPLSAEVPAGTGKPTVLSPYILLFDGRAIASFVDTCRVEVRLLILASLRIAEPVASWLVRPFRWPTFRCVGWTHLQMVIPFFAKHFFILATTSWHSVV